MSESNTHIKLFTTSGCLTTDALKMYSTDQLTNLQKEEVDGHLESCELCSDALEGIQLLSDHQKLDKIVIEINNNLKSNLTHSQAKKNTAQNRLFYIAAAASVIILFGFYFYLQDSFNPESESQSQSISQVIEIEEKSLPPMPKGKSPESNAPVETNRQPNNQVQIEQQESPNELNIKTAKEETIEPDEPVKLFTAKEEKDYVTPLKTLRASKSIPESLVLDEVELDIQEDSEREEYLAVDIASTQPIEYYIGGIVVYDNAITSDNFSASAASDQRMNIAPQMVTSESKKGKGSKRQKSALPQEKSESSVDRKEQNENHFFSLGNEVPQFPGGYEALIVFLNSNLNYPKEARELGLQGQLVVSFMVGENGKISSVKIVHGIGGGCDEEAIRVIESMPEWEPALKDEKPVRVLFNMPITFRLN